MDPRIRILASAYSCCRCINDLICVFGFCPVCPFASEDVPFVDDAWGRRNMTTGFCIVCTSETPVGADNRSSSIRAFIVSSLSRFTVESSCNDFYPLWIYLKGKKMLRYANILPELRQFLPNFPILPILNLPQWTYYFKSIFFLKKALCGLFPNA